MPKAYFQFKQFTVFQDKCAMKVCTDACIFGAMLEVENATNILDIGTGTGLLSLMAAQRSQAQIDAIEIDEDAYYQAINNIEDTIFKDKIKVYLQAIQDFQPTKKYDLILSNPPFYQNSLQSPDQKVNKALHATTLSLNDLLDAVLRLIAPNGTFSVLLPPFEAENLIVLAEKKALYLSKKTFIKHNENKAVFRIIASFCQEKITNFEEKTLLIHEEDGKTYSQAFQLLLKEYYTIF